MLHAKAHKVKQHPRPDSMLSRDEEHGILASTELHLLTACLSTNPGHPEHSEWFKIHRARALHATQ